MIETTPCIEWTGCKNNRGYGKRRVKKKYVYAHRQAYEDVHGAIPNGLCVMHSCDNRSCVNVDHLSLGTHKDNTRDAVLKGRLSRGSRHPSSKLSKEDVMEIRCLSDEGVVQREIASIFGVTREAISRIVTRKNWKVLV